jgi:hypothetical protein
LDPLEDKKGPSVRGFVERGVTVVSDGLPGYRTLFEHRQDCWQNVGCHMAHAGLRAAKI